MGGGTHEIIRLGQIRLKSQSSSEKSIVGTKMEGGSMRNGTSLMRLPRLPLPHLTYVHTVSLQGMKNKRISSAASSESPCDSH